jgi:hypothetical protein
VSAVVFHASTLTNRTSERQNTIDSWRATKAHRKANVSRNFQMKSLLLLVCIGLLSPCRVAFARNSSSAQKAVPVKSDAQISFDALKGLAGKWTGTVTTDPPDPDISGAIQATMRVASAGSVLMHEIAPGGIPEPTMIYLDGDRLTLIHYCEAGNRPRLVAGKSSDHKIVKFDFLDISGSTEPVYLSQFAFTIIDADHHTEDWTFTLPGGNVLRAHFVLKRAAAGAPAPASK